MKVIIYMICVFDVENTIDHEDPLDYFCYLQLLLSSLDVLWDEMVLIKMFGY